MYLHNKYTNWYNQIINRAQNRNISGYVEKHHIIPRSLGGDNRQSNIVNLTAREHFICHLLLTKMTTGLSRRSMCYAAWQMTHIDGRNRYRPTSRMYALLRKSLSESYKGIPKLQKHWLGKKHTDETKAKQSIIKSGKNNPMYGKSQSKETVEKISLAQIGIPKPKFTCSKCGKTVGGKSNYIRWHEDNCPINKV